MLWFTNATTTFYLWALLLPAVWARVCCNETLDYHRSITVWGQEDADTKLDGCTKLECILNIGHNYTGDLIVRGVTNITGGLRTASVGFWDNDAETDRPVPGLTSISAPDLLEIGANYGVRLQNATALKSISFEKLQKAYTVDIELKSVDATVSFPALETITGRLQILGNFTSMNFASLTNVGSSISVRSRPESYFENNWKPLDLGSNPSIGIDFPSLVNCSEFQIVGNISRISTPKLASIADFVDNDIFYNYYAGLKVYTQGLPLNLSFPSLWNTSMVDIAGTIANFSLPALKHVDNFFFRSQNPMSVNLWPLESAEYVSLEGNVTDYNITSLKNVTKLLKLDSEIPIDCGPGKKIWLKIHPEYEGRKDYIPNFSCDEKPKKPFPRKQVGLGLGIGISVLLLVAAVLWRCRRDRKETAKKNQLPDYETEMESRRTGGGEVLPEYTPPRERSSTDAASLASSLSNMARPTERPPGYEASSHAQEGGEVAQGSGR
ncbi:hypothetical protein BKA65DRAFT_497735 [Rhexocercosporidium sp. MPI-PUGE-AT-0058]|nr:hypothetical protein BKA65DRAFT_497735 [Rhexocercosporidium sp. MPI-PUGE-AT-0058]